LADLFVSYARADRARVAPLVAALEAEGWSVWWDPEISPGQEFDRLIGQELEKARAVIVVWTPTSVESLWVRGEAREGRDRGVLAPVRFDNPHLPIDMRAIHATDLDGWGENREGPEFRQLVRALHALTGDPEGRPQAPRPDAGASSPLSRRRWPWRGIAAAGVGIAAVVALAVWRFAPSAAGPTTVAVERISAPTGDAAAQMFADRLPGGLATMAQARPTSLKIVQPGSGDQPGFVIGGEARTVGGDVSATVNVTSARDRSIIWSANFSRPTAQATYLPDQAATRLADVLTCALHSGEPEYRDIEVLKLFLTACVTENAPDGTPEQSRELFRKVVDRAPGLARAWGQLALIDAYVLEGDQGQPDVVNKDRERVEDDAAQALKLDPREARAWTARAVATGGIAQWPNRHAYLEKALALDPDQADTLYELGQALGDIGRVQDSLAAARRGADLDPLTPAQVANLAFKEAMAGHVGDSAATFAAAERRWPDDPEANRFRTFVNGRVGDAAAALKALDDPAHPFPLDPVIRQYLQLLCRARLDPAKTTEAADFMRAHAGKDLTIGGAIQGLAELGRTDDAFAIAEANLNTIRSDQDFPDVFFRPYMTKFLASPRFMPLAARIGLVDIWRRTGLWPDYCTAPGAPYDCKAEAAKAMAALAKPA
jgi:tetratricopeptide (TPR) repeat protein/TolB-like protein